MVKKLIKKVTDGKNLTFSEAFQIAESFASQETSEAQIAALLVALKMKGETVDELTGFAAAMREKAQKVFYKENKLYDCCGTGGDGASTINVSTASAIIAASLDVYMAKHSNRSITSKAGSSDVLQSLNIPLCSTDKEAIESFNKNKIAFLHAPAFHKSTQKVAGVRKQLGIRTIYNFLGPLTNPALPYGQLIGISNPDFCPTVVETLRNLKINRAMVVCATDPLLDELSICGNTLVYELHKQSIIKYEIDPKSLGLKISRLDNIKGADSQTNAGIIIDIFSNKIKDSRKDILLLNTAAILYLAGKAEDLKEGIILANQSLESELAKNKLRDLQKK